MEIKAYQQQVDHWIRTYGVRYFDVKTNTLLLNEEVGELARLIARQYGEQSFKTETTEAQAKNMIKDEIGDILFVLTCISNQLGHDLEDIIAENMKKKTLRDSTRHQENQKLGS